MRSARDNEAGFTIVEILVALLIVSVAAMTTSTLLTSATRNAQRAKASQVALQFAEQELEALRSLEDKYLALTTAPPSSAEPLSPNYRVSGGTFALKRSPVGNYRNLVVNGGSLYGGGEITGGTVSPGPTPFTNGDVSGRVYRYIVWRNDEKCSAAACPGEQDYKQIVVAVRLNSVSNQPGARGYYEVQSTFVNPTDNKESDPVPTGGGSVVTAQQFFLSDTPCSSSGVTVRQEISSSHPLHNTLGTCASGLQNGTTLGAPDALVLGSPPDPDPADPKNPAEYDYANEAYLNTNPDTDQGLQVRKAEKSTGCNYTPPVGESNPQAQVHRWVTDPMTLPFVMTGRVTLQFYTGALGTSEAPGKICVYLFKRHEEGSPPVGQDTLLKSIEGFDYWTLTETVWPREWTKKRLTMKFSGSPYTIPAGDRLGMALSLEAAKTTNNGLSFLYDHPDRLTRLEVDTSTPINGG
jgi:prepilin-type N-terminal cleavage/methylation domain-containing protein